LRRSIDRRRIDVGVLRYCGLNHGKSNSDEGKGGPGGGRAAF
jgi:hypothetical protein